MPSGCRRSIQTKRVYTRGFAPPATKRGCWCLSRLCIHMYPIRIIITGGGIHRAYQSPVWAPRKTVATVTPNIRSDCYQYIHIHVYMFPRSTCITCSVSIYMQPLWALQKRERKTSFQETKIDAFFFPASCRPHDAHGACSRHVYRGGLVLLVSLRSLYSRSHLKPGLEENVYDSR